MPYIKFCGGAGTVTGSMHYVSTEKSHVILDCGLFQGRRDEFYSTNSNFAFEISNLNAVVLSHAHIDHCGNIPTLVKKGCRAKILSTPMTKNLCRFMLPDSGYIQEEDIKYVNKINARRGLPSREPLYTKRDARNALKYFKGVEYHTPYKISKDMRVTFYESGHILGAAVPVLDVGELDNGENKPIRIAYAADLGRPNIPLLRNPETPKDIDYLIIESTYGGKKHENLEEAEEELAEVINRTAKRGGKVIIPSFALERTQMMVYILGKLIKAKKIKKIPIFVDGPLAVNITDVFRENPEYFDFETYQAYLDKEDPLGYDYVTYVKNVNDSKNLNDIHQPVIIISASGMCENGRILHHLKNNVENPNNTIVVIGFMAKDTLGRRIVEGHKMVKIFGRPHDLNAEVVILNAFSSHADQKGLIDYCRSCDKTLKEVFIVHGEPAQSEAFRKILKGKTGVKTRIPTKGDIVELKN